MGLQTGLTIPGFSQVGDALCKCRATQHQEQQVTVSFLYPSSKADEQSLASLRKALDLGLWRLAKRNQSFLRHLALTRGHGSAQLKSPFQR